MAYKDIPGRPGWQFKDDPADPGNKQTALFNKQLAGVRTTGLTQVYTETKRSNDPDGTNRGEISATFYNKGVKPASFFSSLPALGGGGGGGGGGQPSLSGNHSYDAEFGYLVGYFSLDTSWDQNLRQVRDFGLPADGLTMLGNSRMSDADYATVMSDATHISILIGDYAQADYDKAPSDATFPHKGMVFTKDQVVTNPNVTTLNTISADTLGRESAVGGYDMFWHDEISGSGLGGVDYSFVGEFQGEIRDWGSSSLGYNNVSAVGGVAVTDTGRAYTGDWVAVWVTNSGVAPELS